MHISSEQNKQDKYTKLTMREELSILIPTYNHACLSLVEDLQSQAKEIAGLRYEIIVIEDGSTNQDSLEINDGIQHIVNCRYIRNQENVGRARIRNILAKESCYGWLLFIDSDMKVISNDFLLQYLRLESHYRVIYGGNSVYTDKHNHKNSLRFKYEQKAEQKHSHTNRAKNTNRNIHTSNFLIERTLMLSVPFNEHFTRYGYEDVLFGKELLQQGIEIYHINNPVGFSDYEDNLSFLRKTEEGLQTLYDFRKELEGFSIVLSASHKINKWHLNPIVRFIYKTTSSLMVANLLSRSPSLHLFSFYKLGYYLSLEEKRKGEKL